MLAWQARHGIQKRIEQNKTPQQQNPTYLPPAAVVATPAAAPDAVDDCPELPPAALAADAAAAPACAALPPATVVAAPAAAPAGRTPAGRGF